MKPWQWSLVALAIAITFAGGYAYYSYQQAHSSLGDAAQVRMTVTSFGDNLQKMPLLASPDLIDKGMDLYYAEYVRPDLLAKWKAEPENAPGRLTSSPWPDRIELTSSTKNADGTYTVDANIVEVANGTNGPETVATDPVRFTLAKGPDGWQISAYQKL